MSRSAVSQPVWPKVGGIGHGSDPGMHHPPDSPLIKTPPARSQKQRGTAFRRHQPRAARAAPPCNRPDRWHAERNRALLVALAEHSQHMAGIIDVVDIE